MFLVAIWFTSWLGKQGQVALLIHSNLNLLLFLPAIPIPPQAQSFMSLIPTSIIVPRNTCTLTELKSSLRGSITSLGTPWDAR